MTKTNLFAGAALILLGINIALSFQILNSKEHFPPKHGGPKEEIIRRLQLDKQQIAAYEHLVDAHRRTIRQHDETINALKMHLYSGVQKNTSKAQDSIIRLIALQQTEVEHINLNHFRDIRGLLHQIQFKLFDSMTADLNDMFHHGPRPDHP